MVRQRLKELVADAVKKLYGDFDMLEISVIAAENPEHGDYASNIAFALAKKKGEDPIEIAGALKRALEGGSLLSDTAVATPGFLNFRLAGEAFADDLRIVLEKGDRFGSFDLGKGKKVRIEYVSANPTGPIHVGNARGGPIGEAVARCLEKCGYEVTREYYHNDVGTQIEKMEATLWHWYQKKLGNDIPFPEDGYQGEYLREVADAAFGTHGKSMTQKELGRLGLDLIFAENMETARRMGISFDLVVKESEMISSGKTGDAVEGLKKKGVTKEQEGALWFAPGDEFLEDRESVIIRSSGQPTYFASDIAYHKEKFQSGYDLVIDVFGSNHHGHMPKLQALTKIFGFNPEKFRVIMYQYVRVKRGSEIVKMSKRAGTYVTAKEVLDEVGPDSMIFFLLMNSASSHMDFDLEVAREQSQKNPVYYVQYAHARCASILKHAREAGIAVGDPAALDLKLIRERAELDLIKKLIRFPEVVEDTARDFQAQRIPHYVLDLAHAFHNFYEHHRVMTDDRNETLARLALVAATKTVLRGTLSLMAIDSPEKM